MSKLKEKLHKQGGFTLIEMLIVIAIIAILVAIAIPLVNTALERAREATDAANKRAAIGLAMVEYMSATKTKDETTSGIGTDGGTSFYCVDEDGNGYLKSTFEGEAYGKGTMLLKEENNAGQHVKIVVNPGASNEADLIKATWTEETGVTTPPGEDDTTE